MEIHLNKLTPCIPLFKVTKGRQNWNRSIGYLWLTISEP